MLERQLARSRHRPASRDERQLVVLLVGRRNLPGPDERLRAGRQPQLRRLPLHAGQRPPPQRDQVRRRSARDVQRRHAGEHVVGVSHRLVGDDERCVDQERRARHGPDEREQGPAGDPLQRLRQRRRPVPGGRRLPAQQIARRRVGLRGQSSEEPRGGREEPRDRQSGDLPVLGGRHQSRRRRQR